MLIGITGTDGSGKGTVVDYLVREKEFVHYSARAIWIEEINQRGMEMSRANMRVVANEMRAMYGNDFLITHYLKKINQENEKKVIIESIRAVDEAMTLKAHGGILLAIDADQTLRYRRVQARRSESDRVTYEQFVTHEALESNDPDPHGMQKSRVIEMADFTIYNNGSLPELYEAIESVFKKV